MMLQFLLVFLFVLAIQGQETVAPSGGYITKFKKPIKRRKLSGSNFKHFKLTSGSKQERLEYCAQMTVFYGMPSFDFWKKDCYINAYDLSIGSLQRSFRYSYYELKNPSEETLSSTDSGFTKEPKKEFASCPIKKKLIPTFNRQCPPSLDIITTEIKNSNWGSLPPIDENNRDELVETNLYFIDDLDIIRATDGESCDLFLSRAELNGILVKKMFLSCAQRHCLTSVFYPSMAYVALLNGETFHLDWLEPKSGGSCPPGWLILQLHEEVAMALDIDRIELHDESKQAVIRDKGHKILGTSSSATKNLLVRSTLLYALTDPNWTGERYRSFYSNLGYLPVKATDIPYFLDEYKSVISDNDETTINNSCKRLRDMPVSKLLESLRSTPKLLFDLVTIAEMDNPPLVDSLENFFFDLHDNVRSSNSDVEDLSMFEYVNFVKVANPNHILAFFFILTNLDVGEMGIVADFCGGGGSLKYMGKDLDVDLYS